LRQPQKPAEDVVRVSTDWCKRITVVDKDGHFVEGLRQDQFELTVDGKPRPINFLSASRKLAARVSSFT
jgi:hypothetical protein